jgi:hypothetical protein
MTGGRGREKNARDVAAGNEKICFLIFDFIAALLGLV